MSKIFISFLGTGNPNTAADQPGYDSLSYTFEGDTTQYVSRFAQRAIVEKHGADTFDRICLMMTPESKAKHRDLLVTELIAVGCKAEQFIEDDSITTNQNSEQQWEWFDSLQRLINDGDQVIFDFTHGFRSVPIIFSTAISFLQRVKRFELLNAHYGYMVDRKEAIGEIIDMAKFYRINEWADGVSRLVDMADASKLAELADEGKEDGFSALNDPKLTEALRELTDLIKNIDVNNVGNKADEALALIADKQSKCSGADAQLLQMVVDKFSDLAIQGSGLHDLNYFLLQLKLTEMLLKHGLNMQAFTVMREAIGSLSMVKLPEKYMKINPFGAKGRKLRTRFPELFISLIQFDREKWIYEHPQASETLPQQKLTDYSKVVLPIYEELDAIGAIDQLRAFTPELLDYRNGLDHAWTAKSEAYPEITENGIKFHRQLSDVISLLEKKKFLVNE
jgi:CRISPR-associated Csx2 family protein